MLDTGLEIRILRERLKMPAKELAEKVGLSQSQMSRLEKGQRRIDMKVLERIARALDVSPAYFFKGAAPPPTGFIEPAIPEAVGRLIRLERRKRHLSAEDLAEKVGRPKAVIESIEEGKREPDPELAGKILKALRLSPSYFLQAQQQVILGLQGQVDRLNEALAEASRGSLILGGGADSIDAGVPQEGSASREGAAREGAARGGDSGAAGSVAFRAEASSPSSEGEVRRRGTPLLGTIGQGYPQRFDAAGRPVAEVTDFLYLPELPEGAFALNAVGDSMAGEGSPSFREGDLLVFAGAVVRSRDFAFVRLDGEEATFRRVFFDPAGQVRLQPLNLNYPAKTHARERILGTWRLAGHFAKL